jgi:hypothetical protein
MLEFIILVGISSYPWQYFDLSVKGDFAVCLLYPLGS